MRKGNFMGKIFGIALAILAIFSICGALPGVVNVEPVSGSSEIIYVPDNYPTIQTAAGVAGSHARVAAQGATPMVAAGAAHTVGLSSNGTVVAVGWNDDGQCNVGGWSGIQQVAAGDVHTVGIESDGTVVAVGENGDGQCNVGGWSGIQQVSAGAAHTVGPRSNGTVVAVGWNSWGQCDVGGWTDIVQVAAGYGHTVGIESDGTVVAAGENWYGECDVGGWTDIVQVAAGWGHTVGLKSDGTVVAVGLNNKGQCNVSGWTGIVQVAAGYMHTVGIESDGTVVAVGWNAHGECNVGGWSGIAQVVGCVHTVGLRSDGTVVAVGENDHGQCNVGGWDLGQAAGDYLGNAFFIGNGTVSGESAIQGQTIRAGDSLEVFKDSLFQLVRQLSNGETASTHVGEDTRIEISPFSTADKVKYDYFKGKLFERVKATGPEGVGVSTPAIVAAVRGTEWTMEATENETEIVCLEGEVNVSTPNGTQSLTLHENEKAIADDSGLSGPFPVGAVAHWWEQMSIAVASPVNILVTDPLGRHVGTTSEGSVINEIPGATYTGPDAAPEEVMIANPVPGEYNIVLHATGSGEYNLSVVALGIADEPLVVTYDGTVTSGEEVNYSVEVGANLSVHNLNTGKNFSTIQDAIDAVNTTNGHTITVDDGTYNENVNVTKQLTIRSTSGNPADTIVNASNPDDHVFNVAANWVNITGFTVKDATGPGYAGIYLGSGVEHCNISSNNVTNSWYGIRLYYSSSNTIINNNASNNNRGIFLASSSNNTITNNTMVNDGIDILGGSLEYWNTHTIDISNKVNSKPVYYWKNKTGGVVPASAGQVILANCTQVTVENQSISNTTTAILLGFCNNNTFTNNTCSDNFFGIYLYSSSNNTFTSNTANSNDWSGIYLYSSSNNTLTSNTANSNGDGIHLWKSSNNTITSNTVSNNDWGIWVDYSSSNTIANNTVSNNLVGIELYFTSNNNTIYLNNFNNTCNVYSSSSNCWNSTEVISYTYNGSDYINYLGNYWNDYTGSDPDGDGIGETPYPVDSDADSYPLVEPFENYEPPAPPPPPPVGGTVYPVNKLAILAPWIVLLAAIMAGASVLMLRRRRTSDCHGIKDASQ